MSNAGRPRKDHPKSYRIQVYFTEEDFDAIRAYAATHNTTMSELLHEIYLDFMQMKTKEQLLERIKDTYISKSYPSRSKRIPSYFSEEEYYNVNWTAVDLDISESGLIRGAYLIMRSEVLV